MRQSRPIFLVGFDHLVVIKLTTCLVQRRAVETDRDVGLNDGVPETDRFYKALSLVGTDFSLMRNLFPSRTRRDLKVLCVQVCDGVLVAQLVEEHWARDPKTGGSNPPACVRSTRKMLEI